MRSSGTYDVPDQTGRTAVVTGGNSGLGLVTATRLARAGARVILTARTPSKGAAAIDAIRAEHPDAKVEVRALDLASLASVRAFAAGDASVDRYVDDLTSRVAERTKADLAVVFRYVDGYRALHPEDPGFTFPTWDPHVRLDYVFLPAPYVERLGSCEVVTRDGAVRRASDHFPLLARLHCG